MTKGKTPLRLVEDQMEVKESYRRLHFSHCEARNGLEAIAKFHGLNWVSTYTAQYLFLPVHHIL
jgi:hypothetical protein